MASVALLGWAVLIALFAFAVGWIASWRFIARSIVRPEFWRGMLVALTNDGRVKVINAFGDAVRSLGSSMGVR